MFWGVTLESGKRYSQTVDHSYHLTMAALEPPSGEGKKPSKYVSVMVEHQKTEFMVCTLEPDRNLQVPLDHMFVEGEEVTYFLTGDGTVHLTGYLVYGDDEYEGFDEDIEDEEEEEEESEDEDTVQKVNSVKRKNEALESSSESVGKKAKVDTKPVKDIPNKGIKVEEKGVKDVKKKDEKPVINANKNVNQVSKANLQNNKKQNIDSDEDESDDEDEESDDNMDESLGLIDREAVEANDSGDDEEDDEEDEEEDESESDESEEKSPQKKKFEQKGKQTKPNQQKQQNKNQQQKQNNNKAPQNQSQTPQKQQNQSPQNQQKSPQNQNQNQQNRQKQFNSGQKGGFQGNQQQKYQKGNWNQSGGQRNSFGGNQNQNQHQNKWQNKNQFSGQKGQNNSPNPNFKGRQQTPNFKGQKGNANQTPNFNQNKEEIKEQNTKKNERTLKAGLIVEDIREGNGPDAKKGKFVHVNYVGRFTDNKEFDRSGNKPFSFKLGRGEVIKGWDIGLEGMKVGGKRKITVPSNLGYGNRPVGKIPPNSVLQFEVELKAVT